MLAADAVGGNSLSTVLAIGEGSTPRRTSEINDHGKHELDSVWIDSH
jgi:hypothetical protein